MWARPGSIGVGRAQRIWSAATIERRATIMLPAPRTDHTAANIHDPE
jgi:hypothetical protein